MEGDRDRVKVRLRWYGEQLGFIEKPVLEFKIKEGLLGRKDSFKLNSFTLDSNFSRETMEAALTKKKIPAEVRNEVLALQPTMLSQYHRTYYLSLDGKYRLTVDGSMIFRRITYNKPIFLEKHYDRLTSILEMKYGHGDDEEARAISTGFPFLLTKSSKYVQGLERLLF